MRKLYRKLIFITCFSMFCTACAPQYSGKVPPKVVNGEIDLTDWDFEKDGPVKLDGDWLFAWEKFLEPASWEELQKQMGFKVKAPAKWINLQNSSLPANLSNGIGFASYALKIKGLSSQDPGFFFNELYTSANVFLLQESGLIIGQTSQGKPAEQPSDELPLININLQFTPYEYKPAAIQNDIEESARILLIHLSSQQVKYGGVWSSIILSDHENIKLLAWRDILLLGVSFGTFLIIAFYHITLYLQRRADLTSLYFGLFSFALALRVFFSWRSPILGI